MESIVVGLDFSKGSIIALELAIDIANAWKVDINIIFVNNVDCVKSVQMEDNQTIEERLSGLISTYQPRLRGGSVSTSVRNGKIYLEIANFAKEKGASLIVVGSHGSGGFAKQAIGSNVLKIISEAQCSVLSIREDFNFNKKLEHIIFPIDSSAETRQKVGYTASLAKIFGAEINIIGLYSSSMNTVISTVDNYVSQCEQYFNKEGVRYTTEKRSADNITTEVLKYAEEKNADIIVIMTEQEKTFTNLFIGSYASQLLNNSRFPVLSMHNEDINGASK